MLTGPMFIAATQSSPFSSLATLAENILEFFDASAGWLVRPTAVCRALAHVFRTLKKLVCAVRCIHCEMGPTTYVSGLFSGDEIFVTLCGWAMAG